jgi:hypothetical protein
MIDRRISKKEHKNMMRRRDILKNIVFRKILEVRKERNKPKFMQIIEENRDENGVFDVEEVYQRIYDLYGKRAEEVTAYRPPDR